MRRKLRSATVVANPKKEWAVRERHKVEKFLRERGIAVSKNGEILITIGGDGTILYNKTRGVPILGIGTHSSFICQARRENWRAKLGKILERGYGVEKRALLSCELNGRKVQDALNEFALRSHCHRVLEFELRVGKKNFKFSADGLIFATPTGSSAYSYSCGGRELPSHARRYVITPIAPHRRAFSARAVSDRIVSRAVVLAECEADLIVDGQFVHKLKLNRKNIARIYKSRKHVELVKV
ncbi:MAG: hypothetical protein AB1468_00920 [Candidatus Micrarchaeota archaeon]